MLLRISSESLFVVCLLCGPAVAAPNETPPEDEQTAIDRGEVAAKPPTPARLYREDAEHDRSSRPQRYIPRYRYRPGYDADRYGSYLRYRGITVAPTLIVEGAYDDEIERAYQQGLADGRHQERFEVQAERGLAGYQRAMAKGHEHFVAGRYGSAARDFILAATLNQGDPTSRLCATHTQVALGEYEAAAKLLRRALSLQPRLLYLPLDIRSAYGRDADFETHFATLRQAAECEPQDADRWLLVGYYYYYTGDTAHATQALGRAVALSRQDRQIKRFFDLARMTTDPPTATTSTRPTKGT